jgi:hypothetical protein
MAERILLKLLPMHSLDYLRLLIEKLVVFKWLQLFTLTEKSFVEGLLILLLLAVVTQVVVQRIHYSVLLQLQRFYWGREIYFRFEKLV